MERRDVKRGWRREGAEEIGGGREIEELNLEKRRRRDGEGCGSRIAIVGKLAAEDRMGKLEIVEGSLKM